MTLTGYQELVAAYEWDDFALTDTQSDRQVAEVAELPDRDLMADRTPV